MSVVRKYSEGGGSVVGDSQLGARQIRVIASTATPDRSGDVVEPLGCVLTNYLKNPVVLSNHDSAKIIGTFAPKLLTTGLVGIITFAMPGVSALADEICALCKAGLCRAVSIGFLPIESEPIGRGTGIRFKRWELLELSVVSVPANPEALIVERRLRKSGRVLNARNAASLAQLQKCLIRSEDCHATAIVELEKAGKHRAEAMSHAARIAASAGAGADDPDDDFSDPDDSGDTDVELSADRAVEAHRIYNAERPDRFAELLASESRARTILIADIQGR